MSPLFSADVSFGGSDIKKAASKSTKAKANKVMNNDILPHDGHADEEHSPMEIDCKEWPQGALSNDSQARRLFVFRSTGDSSDKYRALLLDMFSKTSRVTRKDFNTRAAQLNLPEPSRKDWMTVQQDLLERYGNRHVHWFLRGTSAIVAVNL
ncbi:DNA-directed RNA polymerase III subunit RPC5 [Acropora cervicornis]|uniref:DNA-directed RNA polymerase III subunit RPC5 n=1 Tax=Acropora cervicornis TaxID=6130 RepID=A0AAD9V835_ACRCE|nr:DNA-directed RNA polymerase III subunit RPC5 [Acropora cervicornis]